MPNVRKNYQSVILSFRESFVKDSGYPPTLDEIRESVGLCSRSHVGYCPDALEQEGIIDRDPWTPRGLRLVGSSGSTFEINGETNIAAGQLLELADDPRQQAQISSDVTSLCRGQVRGHKHR
jgi:SOS-response transcriptional repressor LexA